MALGTDPTIYGAPQRYYVSTNFSSNSPADWMSNIGLFLGRLGIGQLTTLTLDASLALAEEEGKSRIIAAPKVIASSGQEAKITRGDKIITPPTEQIASQEIEATLSLTVKPTISSRDSISLDVTVTDDNAISPALILQKEVKTKFMVKSGETVVIGGIYTENEANNTEGIPVFRKIPLVGWLFKANRKTIAKTELLIFLTATIVPIHRVPEATRVSQVPQ
jgi:type IV pilus assembly protein PilQ